MSRLLLLAFSLCIGIAVQATRISGLVTDEKGAHLAFASILVKGTTRGVTANNEGKYALDLAPGTYTIVCQYVGYARREKKITVGQEPVVVDFSLPLQELSMADVVVRPGGEDPAYEIIRQAIKKRKEHEMPLDSFTCEAYIKTLMKSRKIPKSIFGQKIEDDDKQDMGVDSAGKGILYLSESLTKVSFKRPDKVKLEVLSGRESGSNGYGFSFPTFINFYNNNVNVLAKKLNPRGFVSPIAESALHYYKYRYLGSFWEDGREVNKIQVIPRRKFEPLFSGTINIIENEWRIHSLDLLLVKESQLEILDTMAIRQIHSPIGGGVWQVKDQVVYFTFNIFGFEAVGNFLNVYNNYDVSPTWRKRWFNKVFMKYDTAANKKTRAYWDSVRPVPLEPEEAANYVVRDSVYHSSLDSAGSRRNRDSLLRRQGHVTVKQVLWSGVSRSDFRRPSPFTWSMEPLLKNVEYNTVEGVNVNVDASLSKSFGSGAGSAGTGSVLSFDPHIRYGLSNQHLNAWGALSWSKRSAFGSGEELVSFHQRLTLSGGKQVVQFNRDKPITELMNSIYTLFFRRNYMKINELWFGALDYSMRMDNGLAIRANLAYEDRLPLENSSDYSFFYKTDRTFTPNHPFDAPWQFTRHQAFLSGVGLEWQPGQRFIEYPRRRVSMGSDWPTFSVNFKKGWDGVLGSDVNFAKWGFQVWDDVDLQLKGLLRYRLGLGGFFNAENIQIQDLQHFSGNQTAIANHYMSGFQLAPYYLNSTAARFYATGHIEEHFNGMLTNKVPGFRRLNWNLVAGANGFYVNKDNYYAEVFGGLENIFKVMRLDLVGSWLNGRYAQTGVRVGFGGLLGSALRLRVR